MHPLPQHGRKCRHMPAGTFKPQVCFAAAYPSVLRQKIRMPEYVCRFRPPAFGPSSASNGCIPRPAAVGHRGKPQQFSAGSSSVISYMSERYYRRCPSVPPPSALLPDGRRSPRQAAAALSRQLPAVPLPGNRGTSLPPVCCSAVPSAVRGQSGRQSKLRSAVSLRRPCAAKAIIRLMPQHRRLQKHPSRRKNGRRIISGFRPRSPPPPFAERPHRAAGA